MPTVKCGCRWLVDQRCPIDLLVALEHLPLNSLDEVIDTLDVVEVDERACALAAYRGRADLLAWLRERSWPWDESCCFAAMRSNEMGCLRWALDNGCPRQGLCLRAVEIVNLQALRLLKQLGCQCGQAELERAKTLQVGDAALGQITDFLTAVLLESPRSPDYTLDEPQQSPQVNEPLESPRSPDYAHTQEH